MRTGYSHQNPTQNDTPDHRDTGIHVIDDLVEGLPPQEVHRRALQARQTMAGAHRALCFWLVEAEKREIYRDFGCSSVYGYAELYLELAPHTIAEALRTGKEMAKLPLLAAACERGEIAPSKIREISRVATPQTEQRWLDLAKSSTCRQIEHLVPLTMRGGLPPTADHRPPSGKSSRSQNKQDSPEVSERPGSESPMQGAAEDDTSSNPRDLHGETGDDQAVGPARYHTKLILHIENERMAVLEQAFEKAREETGERGLPALLEHIARVFLDGASSGERPVYRITLHQDSRSGVAWVEGAAGPKFIPGSTVQEAWCDAEILDLRESPSAPAKGKDGQVSPPGKHPGKNPTWDRERNDPARRGPRLRRTIPPTLRRKVLERDGRKCTTPGCNHHRFLSIHHIDPLHQGGEDREHNLTTVCSFCHRALHRGKLSVTGKAPGNLVWKNRWGVILKGSS